jgi:hypothetical protein
MIDGSQACINLAKQIVHVFQVASLVIIGFRISASLL